MEKLGYAHVAWVNACNRIGEENMWSVRLGWVGCRSINFCDDSPFAYILSGAGTFCLGFLRLQRSSQRSDLGMVKGFSCGF